MIEPLEDNEGEHFIGTEEIPLALRTDCCPSCGYTEDDAKLWGDHYLCNLDGKAPWQRRTPHE